MSANTSNGGMSKIDKKKLEEKTMKSLRELTSLQFNKQCCDCNQKGPTYVNITIGTFVCTACSGILRGLNPPHRVKSINMATFTQEEIDFLKTRGNHLCQLVYMSLFDPTTGTQPDSRDSEKLRDFLTQKYERKRWYTAPTDAILNQIKHENEQLTLSSTTTTQSSSSSLSINNSNKLKSANTNNQASSQPQPLKQQVTSNGVNQPVKIQHVTLSSNNNSNSNSNHNNTNNFNSNDLFSSFDAFSTPAVSSNINGNTTTQSANFANFDLFENLTINDHNNSTNSNNINGNSNRNPVNMSTTTNATTTTNGNNSFSQNFFNGQQTIVAPIQPQKPQPQHQQQQQQQNSDRYSALAELDSIFQPATSTSTSNDNVNGGNHNTQQHSTNHNQFNGHHAPVTNTSTNPFASSVFTPTASAPVTNTTSYIPQQQQQQSQNLFFNGFNGTAPNSAPIIQTSMQPFTYFQSASTVNPATTNTSLFNQQTSLPVQYNNANANISSSMGMMQNTAVPTSSASFNFFSQPNLSQQGVGQAGGSVNNPFISIAKQQSQIQKPKTNSTNPFL